MAAERPTPAEPTLGGVWVNLLLDALAGVGFDARGYCRRTGWALPDPNLPDAAVRWSDVVALWEEAARATADSALGLHAAAALPPQAQGPFGYLIMSSATLADGLALMLRYQELHFDGRALSLEDRGDHAALVLALPEAPPALSHQVEYTFTVVKRVCGVVGGPAFRLRGARFRHAAPASAVEHERILECPVQFQQREDALLLDHAMLALPSLYANPAVLTTVRAVAERRLAERRSATWARRVRHALAGNLGASIDDVARQLLISPRSLQRKLAGEGDSFANVLDATRRERAIELIRHEGLTLAEIADEVGFADPRAFARAFVRWTGIRPSAYRTGSTAPPYPPGLTAQG